MNYEVIYALQSVGRKPLLVHIPHSSTYVPGEYRDQICLDDTGLAIELLAMTDRFTDQLFGQASNYDATLLVNRISRLIMDPERFPHDQDEQMSAKGMRPSTPEHQMEKNLGQNRLVLVTASQS